MGIIFYEVVQGGNIGGKIYVIFYFYFISIFVFLTHRKAMEVLIHRVGNYPDLLLEIPRYCCLPVI